MTPPSLPISELAATQFVAADLWIGSDTVWLVIYESVLVQFSLLISESVATQFLAADLWIGSGPVGCWFLNWQRHSLAFDLWVDSGAVLAADF
jgi:hypothetical protein